MRICIFGAGAVGSHFAVRLADAGHEVSCVIRGPHLAAMKAKGLTLRVGDKETHAKVRASDDPATLVDGVIQYTLIGDLDAAYGVAARFPDRAFPARWTLFYDAMAPFRADRRFMAFAARQGLVDIWRRTGRWPDFCRRPDRPYDCARAAYARKS